MSGPIRLQVQGLFCWEGSSLRALLAFPAGEGLLALMYTSQLTHLNSLVFLLGGRCRELGLVRSANVGADTPAGTGPFLLGRLLAASATCLSSREGLANSDVCFSADPS